MTWWLGALLSLQLLHPAASAAAGSGNDGAAIILRAFEAAQANEALARQYVFHERIETRRLGRGSTEKRRQSKTWDVTLHDGSDYRRLIAIDDRPLPAAIEAREARKLARHLEELSDESPRRRRRRMARAEKEREEGEAFLAEITRAFDFRRVGEEIVGGTPTWVIAAEPRPGYRPPTRIARVLTKLRATLWVSREDHGWVQAEIETFEAFSWFGIYRLRSGSRIHFLQRQHDGEVWLTERWTLRLGARIGFVYRFDAEILGSYDHFRRFTTETTESGWSPAE